MKKRLLLVISIFLIGLLAACGGDDTDKAKGNSDDASAISGELEFYTSQPDVDAEQLVAAFNEKYPDIKVNIFRSGTEEVISKVNAEKEAGEIQADVLLVADDVTFESLKEQDLLMVYESPEADAIPAEFIDPDHMYYGTKIMATVLAVNTENVTDLPTSWNVLTSKEGKDQVVMPSPLYSGAAAYNLGVFTRTDGFGWEFYEGIQANHPMITEGNGAVMENVASGQKNYGMVVDYLVARAKNDGSPVEIVYPEEGVPVITEPIGILKGTDQEEAAKAFVDFVLSEEGQRLQADIGYTPIREGVQAPVGLKSLSEFKALSAPTEELYQNREADKAKFDELFAN